MFLNKEIQQNHFKNDMITVNSIVSYGGEEQKYISLIKVDLICIWLEIKLGLGPINRLQSTALSQKGRDFH